MTKELAKIYRPAEFHRWPGPLAHPSNHDPLWLHNFGQPGYQTVTDYGQHVARQAAELAEYIASGRQAAAIERYQAALAAMRKPKPHDCGSAGNPVSVAQCPNCWDAADERFAGHIMHG